MSTDIKFPEPARPEPVERTGSIRDAHKELTRERILDAAIDILNSENLEQLTIAEVARYAGVTERTVYRHFATREDLLKAGWSQLQKRVGSGRPIETAADLLALPHSLFASFDRMPGAVRASAFSQAGLEMRKAVNAERQDAYLKAVKEARPDLDGDALARTTAIVQLISSAWGWAILKDFWNLDADQSGLAASEAIATLLKQEPPKG
jgi:AcrR family transcriptional regulator